MRKFLFSLVAIAWISYLPGYAFSAVIFDHVKGAQEADICELGQDDFQGFNVTNPVLVLSGSTNK